MTRVVYYYYSIRIMETILTTVYVKGKENRQKKKMYHDKSRRYKI